MMTADRKSAARVAFDAVKVGDVFVSSWGHEQTNVDFYLVVAKTAARIRVARIGKRHVSGDGWAGKVVPDLNTVSDKTSLKTVTSWGDEPGFAINSYSSAHLWDGEPKYESSYA